LLIVQENKGKWWKKMVEIWKWSHSKAKTFLFNILKVTVNPTGASSVIPEMTSQGRGFLFK